MTKSILTTLLFTLLTTSLLAGEWTHFRGPNNDGISPEKGLLKDWNSRKPKLLWQAEGFGNGYASVSIANGRIYTTGNTGDGQAVIAASLTDGKPLWKTPLTDKNPKHGYEGSRCTPTVDGDRLYVLTSDGRIACLNASSGKVKWSQHVKKWNGKMMSGWGYSESPLVDGDHVVFTPGGSKAMIVALDKMTGKEIWASKMAHIGDEGKDGAGYSCIAISHAAGVKQYVTLVGRGVIGVRASDGKYLWGYNQVANETACIPTPIVSGDYVLASSGYNGGGTCLLKISKSGTAFKAKEVWWKGNTELQNHHGGMVQLGDYVYLGHKHNSGFPTCVDMEKGEITWGGKDNRGPGKGSAAILAADGNLIFRYQDGTMALIEANPSRYHLKGTFKPAYQEGKTWAHPVIVDGRMYLREQDQLMCYDLRR